MAFGAWIRKYYDGFKETIGGVFAITTTNFIELNIKRGQQFEIREKYSGVAADGGKDYLLLRTGTNPIILKRRYIVTSGSNVTFNVSKTATITSDGTPVFIRNYNETVTTAGQVEIFHSPTFSDPGTLRVTDYLPGVSGIGNRSAGSFNQQGFERILEANTEYLLEIVNDNATDALTYYIELSFYEGPIKPLGPTEVLIP